MFHLPQPLFAPETLTGARAQRRYHPQGHGWSSFLVPVYGHHAITENVEDGDIFELCRTPAKYLLLGGRFYSGDIDEATGEDDESLDIDLGWAANGGTNTETYQSAWGTVYTNAAHTADPDGLLDMGVLTGDAVTDIHAGGNFRPLVLPAPLFFSRPTMIQAEVNTAAETFDAGGGIMFVGWGLII